MSSASSAARPPTLWEAGHQSGREVVTLVVAVLLTVMVLDLLLSERLGVLFDLGFVALCVRAALAVRPADFFTIGVLPPLAMLLVVLLLAATEPASVADPQDGVVQAAVSGLSGHALALLFGYAACLGLLALRREFLARQR